MALPKVIDDEKPDPPNQEHQGPPESLLLEVGLALLPALATLSSLLWQHCRQGWK